VGPSDAAGRDGRGRLGAGWRFRSAQDLHAELRRRSEPVGLTTVYRHLTTLADNGIIDPVLNADGETSLPTGAAATGITTTWCVSRAPPCDRRSLG